MLIGRPTTGDKEIGNGGLGTYVELFDVFRFHVVSGSEPDGELALGIHSESIELVLFDIGQNLGGRLGRT